jgi:curved DNA-binding protein CbpA
MECSAAYEVLSDPRRRRDYDVVRAEATEVRRRPGPMGQVPRPPATPMVRWTRRKATATIVAGVLATLLGIAMSVFILVRSQHDAADRDQRSTAQAVVVREGTPPVAVIHFTTAAGVPVRTPLPDHDTPGVFRTGRTVTVLYRRDDPADIVLDESHFGRDFTLWFVAVKLLVGGPVVTVLGARRRRSFAAS